LTNHALSTILDKVAHQGELSQQWLEPDLERRSWGIGQSAAFLSLDGMLDFIRRFGTMADDASWPMKKD